MSDIEPPKRRGRRPKFNAEETPVETLSPESVLNWSAVVRLIFEKHGRDHQVATVWHPEAQGETLETKLGNVRVMQGPAQYQLTTGEKIEI
jgi:hypothetical protein